MKVDIEDVLEKRLKLVNDWLKFAEQKNTTLLVLNAGVIWGISRLSTDIATAGLHAQLFVWVGLLSIILSIYCCIASFLPILQIGFLKKSNKTHGNDNSLFFGHIANYSVDEYLDLFKSSYELDKVNFLKSHRDYVEQLIENSKITRRKFLIFDIASHLAGLGFLLLPLFFLSSMI